MYSKRKISIIIPTLNEEFFIAKLIPHLQQNDINNLVQEIILVDAEAKIELAK